MCVKVEFIPLPWLLYNTVSHLRPRQGPPHGSQFVSRKLGSSDVINQMPWRDQKKLFYLKTILLSKTVIILNKFIKKLLTERKQNTMFVMSVCGFLGEKPLYDALVLY